MAPIDTLPQQQVAAPIQPGMDVLNSLVSQYQEQTKELPALTAAALKTSPVPGPGTSPSLTMNPVQPFQERPLDTQRVVGARATRDKGITNAITGLTNLVGNYEQKTKANQQRVLAVDLERTMQAQQGASQAEQALKLNPNDADAKSALDRNNKIIDAMLSDPKRRKQIAKALDINFTDPSQNNTPEHGALKEAVKSYSEQLKAATPTTMQPNQVALAKLQIAQGQAASTAKMFQVLAPAVVRAQTSLANNQNTNATKGAIAADTNRTNLERTVDTANAHYSAAVDSANAQVAGKVKVAGMQEDAAWKRTQALIAGRMQVAKQHGTDAVKMLGVMQGNQRILNTYISGVQKQKQQLDLLHINKKIDQGTYERQASYLDGQIKSAQDQIQAGQVYTNSVATSAIGGNNGDTSGKSSSEQNSTSASTTEHVGPTVNTDASEDDPDYYGANN